MGIRLLYWRLYAVVHVFIGVFSMSFQDKNNILGIPKLPPRAMIFLVPFFLSFVMCGIVSFISTAKTMGLNSFMFAPWFSSWGGILDDCVSNRFIRFTLCKKAITLISKTTLIFHIL